MEKCIKNEKEENEKKVTKCVFACVRVCGREREGGEGRGEKAKAQFVLEIREKKCLSKVPHMMFKM